MPNEGYVIDHKQRVTAPCLGMTAAILAILLSTTSPASSDVPHPSPEDIKEAIEELGADTFRERDAASKRVWRLGAAAKPALEEATRSNDPEIRVRAARILRDLNNGIFWDTPPEVMALLGDPRIKGNEKTRTDLFFTLLDQGTTAYASLDYMFTHTPVPTEPVIKRVIHDQKLMTHFYVNERFELVERLLRAYAWKGNLANIRKYTAFVLTTDTLEERIAEFEALYEKEQTVPLRTLLVHLYRAAGDLDKAIALAKGLENQRLYLKLLFEAGDYEALAQNSPRMNETKVDITSLGFRAIYSRLTGREEIYKRAIDHIETRSWTGGYKGWFGSQAMIICEEAERGMKRMVETDRFCNLLECYRDKLQHDKIAPLLASAREKKHNNLTNLEDGIVRFYIHHNMKHRARELLKEMSKRPEIGGTHWVRVRLVPQSLRAGLIEESLLIMGNFLAQRGPKDTKPALIMRSIFAGRSPAAETLYHVRRHLSPESSEVEALTYVYTIMKRNPADREIDDLRDNTSFPDGISQAQWYHAMADIYVHRENEEAAEAALNLLTPGAQSSVLMRRWAQNRMKNKDWEDALKWLKKAWPDHPEKHIILLDHGIALDRTGKKAEGQRWMNAARLIPLDDGKKRVRRARYAFSRGKTEDGLQELRLILGTEDFHSWSIDDALNILARHQIADRKNYPTNVLYLRRRLFKLLHAGSGHNTLDDYLSMSAKIHLCLALEHLRNKQPDEAVQEAHIALDIRPFDQPLFADIILGLREQKADIEAEKIFNELVTRRKKALEAYPDNARLHHEIAWLCLASKTKTDYALPHVKKALELSPGHEKYQDTLKQLQALFR